MLAAAAQPESRLVLRTPLEAIPGPIELVTADLWHVDLWRLADGELTWTMCASSPDRRTWHRGCQRHWETTGEVIEPLDFLAPEQRVALRQRLERAVSMPEPEGTTAAVTAPHLDRIRPKQQFRRGGR